MRRPKPRLRYQLAELTRLPAWLNSPKPRSSPDAYPERYGPVGTVSSRFYRWHQSGVWQRVLEALQAQLRGMLALVVQNHPDRAGPDLR